MHAKMAMATQSIFLKVDFFLHGLQHLIIHRILRKAAKAERKYPNKNN